MPMLDSGVEIRSRQLLVAVEQESAGDTSHVASNLTAMSSTYAAWSSSLQTAHTQIHFNANPFLVLSP